MKTQSEVSLKSYNTFGIDATAERFAEVRRVEELRAVLAEWRGEAPFILGGGSNLLLPDRMERPVVLNRIMGKSIIREGEGKAIVRCGAGEEWHAFVRWCVERGLGGIENLSLIPGTVGAAPIQNIGAYGVELSDVFHSLKAVRLSDGEEVFFNKADCQFGYRDSYFKRAGKGQYCITEVCLELTTDDHRLDTSYGAVQAILSARGIGKPSLRELSDAVVHIRESKLPNPAEIGNSGSFFKNPIIPKTQFERLQQRFPNIVHYPVGKDQVKVPAGWLIEQSGWKGRRLGPAGSYEKQALVLVNHGGATSADIWALAERIMADVKARFGIQLEPEVNII
ncbi:MAG: UDP-N-acetylmuramate dehydrogenase [Bacteroidetes bacterium]|jgi:UDP-N-acetylmuramate dehydrogenase|nr:UDP-N-acetylmuramate dehydrogenase [Bacteroidota bacterium]